MWPLVKAELRYQRPFLVTAVGAILAILIFLWFSPALFFVPEIPFPRRISITFWFLFWISFVILMNTAFPPQGIHRREHRNRLLALLPVPLWQLGILRILLLISAWAALIVIFLLFLLCAGDWDLFWGGPAWPQMLVSLSGAFLTGSAYVVFMTDLQAVFPKGKKFLRLPWQPLLNSFILLSTVAYFLAVCYLILQSSPGVRFSIRILVPLVAFMAQSWDGAAVFVLTGAGTALAGILTFQLRRSFLE